MGNVFLTSPLQPMIDHRWVQKRCDVRARDWDSAFKLWKLPKMIGGVVGKPCATEYILHSDNHVRKYA